MTDAVAACRRLAGRPRPGVDGGMRSSGGSVQIRWVLWTSATNTSCMASRARRKAGSLP